MASLNRVFLMGNLTRDPELRYIPSGQAVCALGLAVNNKYGSGDDKKEEVLFIDVNVWGKSAENCAEYLKKGRLVFVEGRLKWRQWEKDGQKKSKIDVTAISVQFMPTGGAGGGGQPRQQSEDEPPQDAPPGDDEVPF
ncbi:MAG: single-stranded DNA-binding protein [Nitrospinae bacterium]|nr:single-stranded DNA-binding protein [Nitrospinota bacterium]